MSIVDRYILRMLLTAFVGALLTLTGVVWVTQALREVDLLTSQGQTLWLFFKVTLLALPALVMVITPVALLMACLFVLNKLNADSELVVINAVGAAPRRIGRPFVLIGLALCAFTAGISLYLVPESGRELRNLVAEVRADILTDIVEPGQFTFASSDLVFHIRDRRSDGTLVGLLVHDQRNKEAVMTYLAEEGRIVRNEDNTYLAMRDGSIQQQEGGDAEISIVRFDNYVYDLSSLSQGSSGEVVYHPREMRIDELLDPDTDNYYYQEAPGQFRAELHSRFSNILYPLAFVMIALAALGHPRTNRQGRGNAVAVAVLGATVVRIAGFMATSVATTAAVGVPLMYLVPLGAMVFAASLAFSPEGPLARLVQRLPTPLDLVMLTVPPPARRWFRARFGMA